MTKEHLFQAKKYQERLQRRDRSVSQVRNNNYCELLNLNINQSVSCKFMWSDYGQILVNDMYHQLPHLAKFTDDIEFEVNNI